LIAKVAPGKGHKSLEDPQRFARPEKRWVQTVEKAFAEYLKHLEQLEAPDAPKGWEVHDVAYGFKGIGSLGRLRFWVLVGKRDERRLFELKEARPSVMDTSARSAPSA
jgi:uncharacterized protein (DUF2252 family)